MKFLNQFMFCNINSKNKGFGLIGAMVGILISAVLLTAFMNLLNQAMKISRANASELKAKMYLQEMIEVAKDMEQSATSTIFYNTGNPSPCTNCHPIVNGTAWAFDNDPEIIEGFTRSMTISPVLRDISGNLVLSIGTDDPGTKMATATISWYDGFKNRSAALETYLYYYGNL